MTNSKAWAGAKKWEKVNLECRIDQILTIATSTCGNFICDLIDT